MIIRSSIINMMITFIRSYSFIFVNAQGVTFYNTQCFFFFFLQLMQQFGNTWHHSRVRRYLTSEDWPQSETKARPWFGLLALLRKYPEHFVINTRSKGRVTSEFVSLVSLLSQIRQLPIHRALNYVICRIAPAAVCLLI